MMTDSDRDFLVAFGHQLYATLSLSLLVLKSVDQPSAFGEQVVGPVAKALEYVRKITE